MKNINIKIKFLHTLLIFLLALIFFNPFNISKYIIVFLSIYIFLQMLNIKRLNMVLTNIQLWWLLLFCVLYVTLQINYQFMDIRTGLRYLLYPLVFYVFGIVIVAKLNNEKQIVYYLYAVIIGLSLFGVFAVLYSNKIYGTAAGLEMRVATISWLQDVKLAGTGIGMYVCLGISLSGLLFIKTFVYEKRATLLINTRNPDDSYTKYSFPSKTFEYMVSGTPFLTTRIGGIPEEYYQYLYIIKDYSVESVKQKIEEVLTNPQSELDDFGETARQFVLENKNSVVQAKMVVDAINDMYN